MLILHRQVWPQLDHLCQLTCATSRTSIVPSLAAHVGGGDTEDSAVVEFICSVHSPRLSRSFSRGADGGSLDLGGSVRGSGDKKGGKKEKKGKKGRLIVEDDTMASRMAVCVGSDRSACVDLEPERDVGEHGDVSLCGQCCEDDGRLLAIPRLSFEWVKCLLHILLRAQVPAIRRILVQRLLSGQLWCRVSCVVESVWGRC